MRQTLTLLGDRLALVLDRAMLERLHIDPDTPLELETDGRVLTVRPIGPEERASLVRDAAARLMDAHDETFRELAK